MKRFLYLLFAIALCLIPSCSENEWDEGRVPIGVLRFDDLVLREFGAAQWMHEHYYGELSFKQNGEDIALRYNPVFFANKKQTVKAYWNGFDINGISAEQYDGGQISFFDEENTSSIWLIVARNNKKQYFFVSRADVLISNLDPYNPEDETHYNAYCRIDYNGVVIDSLGMEHKFEGWALHNPNIDRE